MILSQKSLCFGPYEIQFIAQLLGRVTGGINSADLERNEFRAPLELRCPAFYNQLSHLCLGWISGSDGNQ